VPGMEIEVRLLLSAKELIQLELVYAKVLILKVDKIKDAEITAAKTFLNIRNLPFSNFITSSGELAIFKKIY
jgi:hypothetical protein